MTPVTRRIIGATLCLVVVLFGAGCVSTRFATHAIALNVTGTVEDASNGDPLSEVELTFASDTIQLLSDSVVGTAMNGKIDLEYILSFCREQRMHKGEWEAPADKFQIVVAHEGFVPAVLDFALDELGDEAPYRVDLGKVALWRD